MGVRHAAAMLAGLFLTGWLCAGAGSAAQPGTGNGEAARPALLLADTAFRPRVTVSWETAAGPPVRMSGERAYRSRGDRSALGPQVDVYLGLGGSRLDKCLGHPRGAIVRVGVSKQVPSELFFDGLAENGRITVELRGVRMNQPVEPDTGTALIHFRYMPTDLTYCGIDPDFCNLYLTAAADDPIAEAVPNRGRFGVLDGGPGHGSAAARVESDGSVTMTFSFPYELLRHPRDPYLRATPGAFLEPEYFTVEMELLPLGVVRAPLAPAGAPPEGDAEEVR